MTNHTYRSVTDRPLIARSFTGSFLVGRRDGTIRVTTNAHPGMYAHWLVGSGNAMRRVQIMESASTTYSWADDEAQISADFARLLRGDLIDGGRDGLEDAMAAKWGLDPAAIKIA